MVVAKILYVVLIGRHQVGFEQGCRAKTLCRPFTCSPLCRGLQVTRTEGQMLWPGVVGLPEALWRILVPVILWPLYWLQLLDWILVKVRGPDIFAPSTWSLSYCQSRFAMSSMDFCRTHCAAFPTFLCRCACHVWRDAPLGGCIRV
jgi:hypothetical protein